jgi:hypothetical protein
MPSVVTVSVTGLREGTWNDATTGITIKFKVMVQNSILDVEFDTNRFEQKDADDCTYFYMRALDLARAAVDVVAFAMGFGLTVFLETLVKPDGASVILIPRDERLAALCTAYDVNSPDPTRNSDFDKVLLAVMGTPALFMNLNDLILGITLPHHGSVNFARAIEGLASLMSPLGTKTQLIWRTMQANLVVDEAYLKLITEHSKNFRHGNRTHVPGSITREAAIRAWTVMNRYFEFLKRGNKPLSQSEFPLLKG